MNELEIPLEDDLYGFVVADKHQDLCCSREGYQKFCHLLLARAPDLLIVTALMTVAISYRSHTQTKGWLLGEETTIIYCIHML